MDSAPAQGDLTETYYRSEFVRSTQSLPYLQLTPVFLVCSRPPTACLSREWQSVHDRTGVIIARSGSACLWKAAGNELWMQPRVFVYFYLFILFFYILSLSCDRWRKQGLGSIHATKRFQSVCGLDLISATLLFNHPFVQISAFVSPFSIVNTILNRTNMDESLFNNANVFIWR